MQLNIETKEEGGRAQERAQEGRVSNLSGCFSILSASYCHLVAKLKMEIESLLERGQESHLKEQVSKFGFGFLNQYN